MDPLLVHPDPAPPELVQALDMGGWAWKGASDIDAARRDEPANGWVGAIVVAGSQPEEAFRFCRAIRSGDVNVDSVLLLIGGGQLGSLDFREDVFDDFCLYPFHPVELEARLKHQFRRSGRVARAEVIEYGALAMNLETYQALIAGKPLDLTYMEYELLKFLASHPGKVFTRETLLSRVWGYDYYGGARTVDVHVRRLRAKLGEEHANLIQTVRSVGYSFGASRWA
ncbi:MAG: response regulator transcription factor [Acidimicrobiales bacterium]|nr:response regulator transcription factor [Acidimicrobiales bacterium]MDG2218460.1 response regulator transcription factor [Acidimicrobiales bacterium]